MSGQNRRLGEFKHRRGVEGLRAIARVDGCAEYTRSIWPALRLLIKNRERSTPNPPLRRMASSSHVTGFSRSISRTVWRDGIGVLGRHGARCAHPHPPNSSLDRRTSGCMNHKIRKGYIPTVGDITVIIPLAQLSTPLPPASISPDSKSSSDQALPARKSSCWPPRRQQMVSCEKGRSRLIETGNHVDLVVLIEIAFTLLSRLGLQAQLGRYWDRGRGKVVHNDFCFVVLLAQRPFGVWMPTSVVPQGASADLAYLPGAARQRGISLH